MQQYIGDVRLFTADWAPREWVPCDGKLYNQSDYPKLFSLIQYTYGGSGGKFNVPDLRGRVAISSGYGTTGTAYMLAQPGGSPTVTINARQLPTHNHGFAANNQPGNATSPEGAYFADSGADDPDYSTTQPNTTMAANSIDKTGGSLPVDIYQPVLGLTYMIATAGIWPSKP